LYVHPSTDAIYLGREGGGKEEMKVRLKERKESKKNKKELYFFLVHEKSQ